MYEVYQEMVDKMKEEKNIIWNMDGFCGAVFHRRYTSWISEIQGEMENHRDADCGHFAVDCVIAESDGFPAGMCSAAVKAAEFNKNSTAEIGGGVLQCS